MGKRPGAGPGQGVAAGRGRARVWSLGGARAGCGRWAGPCRGTWPPPGAGGGAIGGRGQRGDGGGSAVAGAALRPLFHLAHPDHGSHRPPAAAARRDRAAGPDRPVAAVCNFLQGPPDAAAPRVVQGVHLLRSLSPAALLPHRCLRLPERWLQMDQDSCHYLLHPRGHHSVCHPGPHPVPRLLQGGARGASDAARAPGAALHLPALPADPTAAAVHHALQPPLQTRGEEEKEVAGSGGRTHHTCAASGSDPALPESSGTNVSLVLAALAAARKNGIGWSAQPCFDHTQLWQGPGPARGQVCARPLSQENGLLTL